MTAFDVVATDLDGTLRGETERILLTYNVHRGADPRRVPAVGDAANDVELLSGAAVACAMADAAPEVLGPADHVRSGAGSGGWAGIARIALD